MRGVVRVWPVDVRDPQFKYVRWCSDLEVVDLTSQRVVGALSQGGKEGHLSEREATAKVVRVMQEELSAYVAKTIAGHVYGEWNCRHRRATRRDVPKTGWSPPRHQHRTNSGKGKIWPNRSLDAAQTSTRAPRSRGRGLTVTQQRVPSRLAKRRLNERLKNDTASFNLGNLTDKFRKEGYDELPLDELQDRLSKLSGPLAAIILKGRV